MGVRDLFEGIGDGHSVVRPKPEPDVFVHAAGQVRIPCAAAVVVEEEEVVLLEGEVQHLVEVQWLQREK